MTFLFPLGHHTQHTAGSLDPKSSARGQPGHGSATWSWARRAPSGAFTKRPKGLKKDYSSKHKRRPLSEGPELFVALETENSDFHTILHNQLQVIDLTQIHGLRPLLPFGVSISFSAHSPPPNQPSNVLYFLQNMFLVPSSGIPQ